MPGGASFHMDGDKIVREERYCRYCRDITFQERQVLNRQTMAIMTLMSGCLLLPIWFLMEVFMEIFSHCKCTVCGR